MGFIEETGAAQHFRDARITTIYEGTTGIQASDLAGRKLVRDGGAMAKALIAEMSADAGTVTGDGRLGDCGRRLADAIGSLGEAVDWMLDAARRDPRLPAAASYPYLMLWGTVAGGWQMVRAARAATRRLEQGTGSESFHRARITTADYYGRHVLPRAGALCATIVDGSEAVLGATDEVL
jgi:hypothetical protein